MIALDDVTLTGAIDEGIEVRFRSLTPGQPFGQTTRRDSAGQFQACSTTFRPGLWVEWCEALRILRYKVSVPRLLEQPANFPLHPCASLDELPLERAARDVLGALGLRHLLDEEPDPVRVLDVPGAGVRGIAYAIDLPCRDVQGLLRALGMFRRQRSGLPDRFSDTGCQWGPRTTRYRVQIYDKAAELRQNRTFDRNLRRTLSEAAEGIVRVEVTLGTTSSVRGLLGLPGGRLPTLELMARPEVATHALRRELYGRLGLDRFQCEATDSQELGGRLTELDQRLGDRLGSGARATLLAIHHLQSTIGDVELCRLLRMQPRTLQEHRRTLRNLGFGGPPDLYGRRLVHDFLQSFRQEVSDHAYPWPDFTPEQLEDLSVDAPWTVDEYDPDEDSDDGFSVELHDPDNPNPDQEFQL